MAIFNVFKKKKPPVEKKPAYKAEPSQVKKAPLKPKKASAIAYRVLKEPQITEKATDLTKKNQYVFKVYERTNKKEIKKTVEDVYGVDVVAVKIIKIPPKKRRLGRIEGWQKGYKKAIVKLKEGQKIELLPR